MSLKKNRHHKAYNQYPDHKQIKKGAKTFNSRYSRHLSKQSLKKENG